MHPGGVTLGISVTAAVIEIETPTYCTLCSGLSFAHGVPAAPHRAVNPLSPPSDTARGHRRHCPAQARFMMCKLMY